MSILVLLVGLTNDTNNFNLINHLHIGNNISLNLSDLTTDNFVPKRNTHFISVSV